MNNVSDLFLLSPDTILEQVRSSPINIGLATIFSILLIAFISFDAKAKRRKYEALIKARYAGHPTIAEYKRYTKKDLSKFDGVQSEKIFISVKNVVFDVTKSKSFYDPGGPYHTFAGRDASRGLAQQSFAASVVNGIDEPIDDLKDLSDKERDNLNNWFSVYQKKYDVVGELI